MTAEGHRWRPFLLAICAAQFAAVVISLAAISSIAAPGFQYMPLHEPFTGRVSSVVPQSAAAAAGVRVGDRIDFAASSAADRYRLAAEWHFSVGDTIAVQVERNSRRFPARFAATPANLWDRWDFRIGAAGVLWISLFAAVICLRRPDAAEARLLALMLIAPLFGLELDNLSPPWPALGFGANILDALLASVQYALGAAYLMLFARPPSRLRRACTALTYAWAGAYALWNIVPLVGAWTGALDPNAPVFQSPIWNFLSPLLPMLACGFLAIRDSRGAERTRLSWAAAPLMAALTMKFAANYLGLVAGPAFDGGSLIYNISLFVLPLGLTYSLLNRHLLDIGFALNRAAVFAATSLVLAGLFAGLQWAANAVLTDLSHAHNVLVQVGIAVIVYYVVRLTRHQTDQLIGRVFFAKRQHRIDAIRALAHHVDVVTDAGRIATFVAESLRSQAQLDAVVLLQREDGTFEPAVETPLPMPRLQRDDALLITLRAEREPRPAPDWAGAAAIAFPMLVRGRLRGVLIARALDGDELAPDESVALFALAREMASARDDLLAESLRQRLNASESRLREFNLAQ